MDDFDRRVEKLMEEVVAETGQEIKWRSRVKTPENPHPGFFVRVSDREVEFQIDQEERVFSSDAQIKELIRTHVRGAIRGSN